MQQKNSNFIQWQISGMNYNIQRLVSEGKQSVTTGK